MLIEYVVRFVGQSIVARTCCIGDMIAGCRKMPVVSN